MNYPKRLIEVDLPIKRISEHARREKSIRHGHISTLHIWWARRPLAACRAVLCASLWPDPADALCPESFVEVAKSEMLRWAENDRLTLLSKESMLHFMKLNHDKTVIKNNEFLRSLLFDFIADFSNWDNSTNHEFIKTCQLLTKTAHESLSGDIGTLPLVVDSFSGGGSIPLESLRVGADVFASDLNPIPVLLNKVLLEYIPRYGQKLADHVRVSGEWIKTQAEKELAEFYPRDNNDVKAVAYLWARTIKCEGPNCGAEVPLIRTLWLTKKNSQLVAMQLIPKPKEKKVEFQIILKKGSQWVEKDKPENKISNPNFEGTVKRGSATCPCCGYTTPVAKIREQLKLRMGGARDARLYAVVTTSEGEQGRTFRLPTSSDLSAISKAEGALKAREKAYEGKISLIPDETLPVMSGVFNAPLYGHTTWGSLFTYRQALALTTLVSLVKKAQDSIEKIEEPGLANAVGVILALAVSRLTDISNSLCNWSVSASQAVHLFGRQAIPMMWDFAETSLLSEAAGDIGTTIKNMLRILERESGVYKSGQIVQANAAHHPLPDDMCSLFFTDPPYYNAVPYADLSDFFYVWLRRMLGEKQDNLFTETFSPKAEEICEMAGWDSVRYSNKDKSFFEKKMAQAMSEGRRILKPEGLGIIVFAHKSTSGWEAQLQAMLDAGWVITGSWPIDTERPGRLRSQNSAALASSVHLVCRPREKKDGSIINDNIGDWRDVLKQLPRRIHEWMPRLSDEGVVGADAIFACLGPALEVFSQYSSVEKPNGDIVSLKEYLEQVWAAVSQEALSMVFKDIDTKSLEVDARITAMWLWTVTANVNDDFINQDDDDLINNEEGVSNSSNLKQSGGYILEFDTARKIAQGLGANLEDLITVIELKGETARLIPVIERTLYLFGSEGLKQQPVKKKKKIQASLFENIVDESQNNYVIPELKIDQPGKTVLDRVHQAMLLFAATRTEALKRFLLEDGIGKDERFWKLAQALTALYPKDTDERRWVEAVQTYKKSLGF